MRGFWDVKFDALDTLNGGPSSVEGSSLGIQDRILQPDKLEAETPGMANVGVPQ